jgi:hypothetical protein
VAAAPSNEPVVLRGSTAVAAKTKPAAPARSAVANATGNATPAPAQPSQQVAQTQPAMQRTASATRPDVASDAPRADNPQLRTAFTAPPAANGTILPGAQPVMQTGSFESRWSGVR